MRTRLKLSQLLCVTALALLLADCAGAQPASPEIGAPTTIGQAAKDLIARTGPYYADAQALEFAELRLTAHCMAALRLRYSDQSAPLSRDEEWRPDLTERQRHGYGLQRALDPQPPEEEQYVRDLPPVEQEQYELALAGKPSAKSTITLHDGSRFIFTTQGCVANSRTTIYGSTKEAARVYYLPQTTYVSAFLKIRNDARYSDALHRWSNCMTHSGYPYASPADAKQHLIAEYRNRMSAPTAHDHEVAVAVADATCAVEAGVSSVVESLLIEYASQLPAADRSELNSVAESRAGAAKSARSLIGQLG